MEKTLVFALVVVALIFAIPVTADPAYRQQPTFWLPNNCPAGDTCQSCYDGCVCQGSLHYEFCSVLWCDHATGACNGDALSNCYGDVNEQLGGCRLGCRQSYPYYDCQHVH